MRPWGAAAELGAILLTAIIAWLDRGRGRVHAAPFAMLLAATALASWLILVVLVNSVIASLDAAAPPPEWQQLRGRREWDHADDFLLWSVTLVAKTAALAQQPKAYSQAAHALKARRRRPDASPSIPGCGTRCVRTECGGD